MEVKTLLCESRVIDKNAKYRIIKYNDEYFMIDLSSNYISYLLPMINWFIPKKGVKLSVKEVEKLDTIKPQKNSALNWYIGFSVLLTVIFRKYISLLDLQIERYINISISLLIILFIILFRLYINKKLTIKNFHQNEYRTLMLIPTWKSFIFTSFAFVFIGLISIFTIIVTFYYENQNIIVFLTEVAMILIFSFLNVLSISDSKVHVIIKENGK
ncbi:TPA: DUF443 family protein [Staphylococcus aureus]|uniref:DUF443 family protein n=1 Tax=Staphylococcus aureus TaxID=1280 RepID=UPI000423EEDA|nr:DUF443 family protein [Staphylococcus aureus]MBO8869711.1 DUF443 family protein [Staphylococcus aureus]MCO4428766.1 hypothetical protein [Staphylococcus aureus]MCO4454812.1 hypothetical protein [Staphylococcus aureus]MCT6759893.1 DUF443 family protein [Staphylococcus aureus]MCX2902303.1 DUF443 family protein [Staphylococcus aureus]